MENLKLWKFRDFVAEVFVKNAEMWASLWSVNLPARAANQTALANMLVKENAKLPVRYTEASVRKAFFNPVSGTGRGKTLLALAVTIWETQDVSKKAYDDEINKVSIHFKIEIDVESTMALIGRTVVPEASNAPVLNFNDEPLLEEAIVQPTHVNSPALVVLTPSTLKDIEDVRHKYGESVAKALETEKLRQESAHLKMASLASEPLTSSVKVTIPKAPKGLPYMVLQLFFLMAALFDPTIKNPVEIKFDREVIATRMTCSWGQQSADELLKEIARLRQALQVAESNPVRNQVLEARIGDKLRLANEALNNLSTGKSNEIGSYETVLEEKTYNFYCSSENEAQVRSLIRRWRLYQSDIIPTREELTATEEHDFLSSLPQAVFHTAKIAIKSAKDDLITSILSLRTLPLQTLQACAHKVNQLGSVVDKVTEVYNMVSWPQWCQKIFSETSTLSKAVNKIAAEAEKMYKAESLTKEEKAFFSTLARLENSQITPILARAGAQSTAELPAIWKIAIIDSLNKADPDRFLKEIADGTLRVEDMYELPKVEAKKKSFSEVLKQAEPKDKVKGAQKASYVPNELLSLFAKAYPTEKVVPSFLGEMYAVKPKLTTLLVKNALIAGMAGIQNAKIFLELNDGSSLNDFLEKVYMVKILTVGEGMFDDQGISTATLNRIRVLISTGQLKTLALKLQKEGVSPIRTLEDLEKQVSSIPARAGPKPAEGKPAQSGSSSPAPKSGKKKRGGKKPAKSAPKSGSKSPKSGKGKPQNNPKSKPAEPKPAAPAKPSPNSSTPKAGGRSVKVDGKDVPVNELHKKLEAAKKSGADSVVYGNNSFTLSFLAKMLGNKEISSIGSRFDKDGKPKSAPKGSGSVPKAAAPKK